MQFELLGFLARKPELKASFAKANEEAQAALAELLGIQGEALIGGLAAQWLVAPDSMPTGTSSARRWRRSRRRSRELSVGGASVCGVRVATWNVNSVKQRMPRLLPWLDQRRP
ncbi:MAG: hypothetical protein M3422_10275, partial [Actinomycetota bacterium]|nr:hypothetical protein [Actinomycetota bacterium]